MARLARASKWLGAIAGLVASHFAGDLFGILFRIGLLAYIEKTGSGEASGFPELPLRHLAMSIANWSFGLGCAIRPGLYTLGEGTIHGIAQRA